MPELDPDLVAFLRAYPAYTTTHIIDDLRTVEYARLDLSGHIYLDYTGGGLYAESQCVVIKSFSTNTSSAIPIRATPPRRLPRSSSHARQYTLKFFHANPEEYLAIFTANASGALKLVGESYPFPHGRYLLTFDNHNSVNGIREFAHARGAQVTYIPVALPDMRVGASQLERELARPSKKGHNLFA